MTACHLKLHNPNCWDADIECYFKVLVIIAWCGKGG